MLPGEQHRDQHPQNLVVGQLRPVFIPGVDERLQHVRLQTPALSSRLNHLVKNQRQIFPRLISFPMRLDRRVREKHRQRHHPFIQIVHQRRHLGKQILANFSPEQTSTRGQNDQLAQRVQQIHLAFVSPLLEKRIRLFHHHPDVRS